MNMNKKLNTIYGNWTTRRYANSRIANSRTGHVADWTTRGLADAAKRTKARKVAGGIRELSSPQVGNPRVGVSAFSELSSNPIYRHCRHVRLN